MISFTDLAVVQSFNNAYDYIIKKYNDKSEKARLKSFDELTGEELISLMYVSTWKELKSFLTKASDFDKRTHFSREYIGEILIEKSMYESDAKYHLYISLRFIWEFNLSIHTNQILRDKICYSAEFVRKLDNITQNEWNNSIGTYPITFSWIVDIMPFDIYREFLSSSDLQEAKKLVGNISHERENLKNDIENIISQADSSVEYLDAVRNEAQDLGERLTNIKREGNFKLLAKAFSTLRKSKKWEARFAQVRMWVFVLLLISLPIVSFLYFENNLTKIDLLTVVKYISLISLEVLFFYFMRLFYIEVKSLKSQLVQIDLRLNLCEFIYDYIETRDKTHSDKVNDSWKAFESLIFSPIQPNEDKIPSVMDGTDVLADLAGKILKAKQS